MFRSLRVFGQQAVRSRLSRSFATSVPARDKVVAVLYTGELDGVKYYEKEPRLLGCAQNALGLRPWLSGRGHTLVALDSKEEQLDKEIADADVLITTPFFPAYVDKRRFDLAKKIKLIVTAGVGSDHIDLHEANKRTVTVAEVTGSNVVSVAEHVVMQILALVRNFVDSHNVAVSGGWHIAKCAHRAFDLEGKVVGTVGAGRIGYRVLQRLKPFDCKELLYADFQPLPKEKEDAIPTRRVSLDELISSCDVVTINCPLHDKTRGLFDRSLIAKMKEGSYLVNTARGAICDANAVADAVNSGRLAGYAGDVWFPQPPPADHPWRSMSNNAMTPHYSGTTLDGQARYAAGVKNILESYFDNKPYRPEDIIVQNGNFKNPAYVQP